MFRDHGCNFLDWQRPAKYQPGPCRSRARAWSRPGPASRFPRQRSSAQGSAEPYYSGNDFSALAPFGHRGDKAVSTFNSSKGEPGDGEGWNSPVQNVQGQPGSPFPSIRSRCWLHDESVNQGTFGDFDMSRVRANPFLRQPCGSTPAHWSFAAAPERYSPKREWLRYGTRFCKCLLQDFSVRVSIQPCFSAREMN